jgi:two-component sensor histidine kinase
VLKAYINEITDFTIDYDQSVITLEFAGLNYIDSEKNQYAYRLKGFEENWNEVETKRTATYTNLEPGQYVFQVKAANNDGVWTSKPKEITITITPPFWETWWFKALVALVTLMLIYVIYRVIRKRIREKISINKLIAELEIKALIAQMNPHFIFNSLTSIQELIMVNKQKEAMHYLHQFSRLLRNVLESSEKNTITLAQEKLLLELYLELEAMRFDKQFSYDIIVDQRIDAEEVVLPSFLLQPFVENALWHGLMHKRADRKLTIKFEITDQEHLICSISDNGIGRKQAEELKRNSMRSYQSMGLKIMKERIHLMKQQNDLIDLKIIDRTDENGNALGTTVMIQLPIESTEPVLTEA